MDTIKIMRQFIFICIAALLSAKGAAQSLTDCTLSACGFQTDELDGLAGEASAASLSSNAASLSPGFIEALLAAQAEDAEEEPDPEPPIVPEPEPEPDEDNPTAIDPVEDAVSVSVAGNVLHVKCTRESRLAVYAMTGHPVILREVIGDTEVWLPASGPYVIVVQNPSMRKVYKAGNR